MFNYRAVTNSGMTMDTMANIRHPDSQEKAQKDIKFLLTLCKGENKVAPFSHYFAHLVMILIQGEHSNLTKIVQTLRPENKPNLLTYTQVIRTVTNVKLFVGNEILQSIAQELANHCLNFAHSNMEELRSLTRKDMIDFVDNLERFLLHVYECQPKQELDQMQGVEATDNEEQVKEQKRIREEQ